jgi:hypothetical protein
MRKMPLPVILGGLAVVALAAVLYVSLVGLPGSRDDRQMGETPARDGPANDRSRAADGLGPASAAPPGYVARVRSGTDSPVAPRPPDAGERSPRDPRLPMTERELWQRVKRRQPTADLGFPRDRLLREMSDQQFGAALKQIEHWGRVKAQADLPSTQAAMLLRGVSEAALKLTDEQETRLKEHAAPIEAQVEERLRDTWTEMEALRWDIRVLLDKNNDAEAGALQQELDRLYLEDLRVRDELDGEFREAARSVLSKEQWEWIDARRGLSR